jgi:hypothetical protein
MIEDMSNGVADAAAVKIACADGLAQVMMHRR